MALDGTLDRYASDDARHAAIVARDRAADGHFWVCVRTTGVYCRPSCASRTPKRGNVRFETTRAACEAAGFRACLRCRPDERDRDAARAAAAGRAIEAALDAGERPPPLAALARAAGLSASRLQRVFKAATGVTPADYAAAARARRLGRALADAPSVTDAIYAAGYGSSGRAYEAQAIGMTPSTFRAGGAGETIRFAVGPSAQLGQVLVAATARGVCAVLLGDDADALLAELQRRFPRATLTGGDAAFEALVGRVMGAIAASGAVSPDLPLDLRGTAFQRRVWQALRAIPPGRTASYAEIARAVGAPAAVRAVAGACGANPAAVVVPCHRVVRIDGGMGGYRWGLARKQALLAREAG